MPRRPTDNPLHAAAMAQRIDVSTPMTGESAEHGHDNDHDDQLWCETCQHLHIPTIPGVTWLCRHCGWGQWTEADAQAHVEACPGHEPYRVGHHIPERFRIVRREAKVAALREAADLIQELHPGEVKASVVFLRTRADLLAGGAR